ncbi:MULTISPECIES: hypothetical protein [unclassified Nitratiruptor]|uniref:hypothetical protein n=1 Tax=unclassified Nitratiruptor TaxID=2624044 RepID=UPI0019168507|nr:MULTISPECIES: hypothetical protein [unclassified Nitratiruptor]BCD60898.1 hypothetical protein NitYY0810_C1676 [Nitratiruptor sp. YY08-10]BCD64830.1 hypothetical protein NitYY0814_C1684 [Nitratiruptor sp. YY08-14]
MLIVVPTKEFAGEDSKISTVTEAQTFVFVQLGEGMQIEEIHEKPSFENELFDYIVSPDKSDNLEEAFNLGARALLARNGMSVEEIVEALMFRELDEIV